MWRVQFLSVGISILRGWAKDRATPVADCQRCAPLGCARLRSLEI